MYKYSAPVPRFICNEDYKCHKVASSLRQTRYIRFLSTAKTEHLRLDHRKLFDTIGQPKGLKLEKNTRFSILYDRRLTPGQIYLPYICCCKVRRTNQASRFFSHDIRLSLPASSFLIRTMSRHATSKTNSMELTFKTGFDRNDRYYVPIDV